jgi:phosphatidylglycerophosphatase A
MNSVAMAWATWFGCGFAPKGPGTAGSLGAILVAYVVSRAPGWQPWHLALLALVLLAPSIWSASRVAVIRNTKDPQIVVVDEVLGQWITLSAAAVFEWRTVLAGFVLFRLFDIVKPWPVRQLEALPGGVGIIADDIMAGLYGAVVLRAAVWFNLL